ncbi:hypothetical protein QAD02_009351 [Eretmocerus hayati]|uniref:Uncharacterized protein n=1 Tax=Eretmocerus hayati TaxID=131215 RepID=A0ACC2N992_9HYME|nr:hypothetical protein QAD02_009351 [Eretmocerus hayati]
MKSLVLFCFVLSAIFVDYASSSRNALQPINSILNPKGLKIVQRSDCPEVEPDMLRTIPGLPLFLDVAKGKAINEAIKDAFVRTKNAVLKNTGYMIVRVDQCFNAGNNAEISQGKLKDIMQQLQKKDPEIMTNYPYPSDENSIQDDSHHQEYPIYVESGKTPMPPRDKAPKGYAPSN